MKLLTKTTILLTVATLLCIEVNAQARLGLKGGVNLTKFSSDEFNANTYNRAVFGAFGEIPLIPNFSFSTEINYSNEGTKYEIGNLDRTKISYLEIPVLANIYFTNTKVRPKIFGGPSMSFLMNAENVFEDGSTVDLNDQYKENEIGVVLGAGVDLQITGENYLLFDIRYDFGMTEINDLDVGAFQNRGFRLSVGASFPISQY